MWERKIFKISFETSTVSYVGEVNLTLGSFKEMQGDSHDHFRDLIRE